MVESAEHRGRKAARIRCGRLAHDHRARPSLRAFLLAALSAAVCLLQLAPPGHIIILGAHAQGQDPTSEGDLQSPLPQPQLEGGLPPTVLEPPAAGPAQVSAPQAAGAAAAASSSDTANIALTQLPSEVVAAAVPAADTSSTAANTGSAPGINAAAAQQGPSPAPAAAAQVTPAIINGQKVVNPGWVGFAILEHALCSASLIGMRRGAVGVS